MTTVFKQIIDGKIPSKKVFENERILAIEDIQPVAPVHILILPKKEISDLQSVEKEDLDLISEMILVAQEIAKKKGIEKGYRLVTNIGKEGGQEIFHLHFHLIGGAKLGQIA